MHNPLDYPYFIQQCFKHTYAGDVQIEMIITNKTNQELSTVENLKIIRIGKW